jgi:SAM-dependent methyltransferase
MLEAKAAGAAAGPAELDEGGTGYLTYRPDVHSRARSAPYRHVAGELERLVSALAVPAAPAGSKVLDYGCAERPYRSLFGAGVDYVGADLAGNRDADVNLNSDGTVPEAAAQFDLVLSTQVLEHVADPTLYVSECFRVLKPGGVLVITTHGLMHYHPDPVDYWRWTSAGFERLLSGAGFDPIELRGILGLAAAAVQLFQEATMYKLPPLLRRPYVASTQALVELLDHRYSEATRVANSLVIAARATRPRR